MAIHVGAQYYRPPFPVDSHWEDDLRGMKDAGLHTVQLWMVWGWIEAKSGTFDFSDYDRLIEIAQKNNLSVVLSTIAAIHPYWIHSDVPDSQMVTNMGHRVVSSNRRECHYGLTPGGCLDHPGVHSRMEQFLVTAAERYAAVDAVVGWDVWNELRWNVHADGLVCYCEHTTAAFRRWLADRYGDLSVLNAAWHRRYSSWEEVLPGKMPGRTYTEMMAFEEFLSARSVAHARWRYALVKERNPDKPVTVHGGKPTVLYGNDSYAGENCATTLHRGNDWGFAELIDGVGTSSFPVWEEIDHTDFISRIDFVRAPAEQYGRELWLSELQGGRSADGYKPQKGVPAAVQQRWVYSGLAAGSKTILFWCWRDEVFGRESAGFGISGADGFASERIAALQKTRTLLDEHRALFESYHPDSPSVGVWFSPRSYYQHWAQEGDATQPMRALQGISRALVRASIPWTVIEEDHTDALSAVTLLFMPRAVVLDAAQEKALSAFVENGGTIVTESDCGAFGQNGIYRYPEERWLSRFAGITEHGRRPLPSDTVPVAVPVPEERTYFLPATGWATPFTNGSLTAHARVGRGQVVAVGLFSAQAYYAGEREADGRYADSAVEYERFVCDLVAADGSAPPVSVREAVAGSPLVHVRTGRASGGGGPDVPVLYVIREEPASAVTLVFKDSDLAAAAEEGFVDLVNGTAVRAHAGVLALPADEWGVSVLVPSHLG